MSLVRSGLAVLAGTALLVASVGCAAAPASGATPSETPASQIANPASENCVARGGKLVIERGPAGETGTCTFPDGSKCEEWAFFRGECAPGQPSAKAAEPEPTRIAFAKGGTDYYTEGKLAASEVRSYVLRASQGQFMSLNLDSPGQNVHLTAYGVDDGQPLVRAASDATDWHGVLPATQDYVVKVVGPSEPATYSLTVVIPARVDFPSGATRATVRGETQSVATWLVTAEAGQKLTLAVSSPSGVHLSAYGLDDGQQLLTAGDGAQSWPGQLAVAQEYAVTVLADSGPSSYELAVTLE